MKKKVFLVVGGTGGHIYPGVALLESLSQKNEDIEFEFIIDRRPLASKVLTEKGYVLHKITAAALPRKEVWRIFRFMVKMLTGFLESLFILRKKKPDIIVAFGAYISVPVVIAASLLRIPVILHEQNYFPGLANKFLTSFASKVAITFTSSRGYFPENKTIVTGNPVRPEMFTARKDDCVKFFDLDEDRTTLLVFGGSLGSNSIDMAVVGVLPYLEECAGQVQVIHITGSDNYEYVKEAYMKHGINARVFRYLKDMKYAYGMADIIIARSGATTIAEITSLCIPAILIPFPKSTSQHQLLNTIPLSSVGGIICYDDESLGGEGLALKLLPLIKDPNRRREMSIKMSVLKDDFREAADRLSNLVIDEMDKKNV